jgi:hypothetical protein
VMPNGWLGSPVLVLLFGLDRGFLMEGGPERAEDDVRPPCVSRSSTSGTRRPTCRSSIAYARVSYGPSSWWLERLHHAAQRRQRVAQRGAEVSSIAISPTG